MIKALSWSELDCWERSPENWYMTYVLGLKEPANPAMRRGTDLHRYLFAPSNKREIMLFEWEKLYNKGELRINKFIQGQYEALVEQKIPDFQHEIRITQEIDNIPTCGYWDGFHENQSIILEVKTGAKVWTQKDAENHGQIHLYAAQWQCKNETVEVPWIWLFSASTENGRAALFQFKPNDKDMFSIRKRVKTFWQATEEQRENRVMSQ